MSEPERNTTPPASQGFAHRRHWLGFILSGTIAFLVDATVLTMLVAFAGIDPFSSRLCAISIAMIAGWLCHRRFTFAISEPANLREFTRYAISAWSVAALNYAAYSAILLVHPPTPPLAALFAASALSMLYSYIAMRYAVFR